MKQEQQSTAMLIMGSNKQGQLGITQQHTELKEHNYGVKIQQIACGAYFTVLLLDTQQCCVLGFNLNKMIGLHSVDQVACGAWHIMVRASNQIYSWGQNDDGQLGIGDYEPRNEPTLVQIKAGQIVCGAYHTLIYDKDQAHTFGRGSSGQLLVNQERSAEPIEIPYPKISFAAASEYQTFIYSNQLYLNGVVIPFYGTIKQLACNRNYSAVVTSDGDAIFWDRKGDINTIKNILQLSMFGEQCYLMKFDQSVETLDNEVITKQPIRSMYAGEQHAIFQLAQISYNSVMSDSLLLSEQNEENENATTNKYLKKIAELQLQLAKKDALISQLQFQLRQQQ